MDALTGGALVRAECLLLVAYLPPLSVVVGAGVLAVGLLGRLAARAR